MTPYRTLDQIEVAGKRVLVRVDLNVPMAGGSVADDTRLRAVAPTITELSDKAARVILLAHFGRPKGKPVAEMSLAAVASALALLLDRPVHFCPATIGAVAREAAADLTGGEILLLENTRFDPGEEANDPALAEALAELGDIYVNDAFSAAHRAHASTEGIARLLPAVAGRSLEAELAALETALTSPDRPLTAVVGGAKISTKLDLLGNLTNLCDTLIIGGGMANTFLAARGIDVGKSLCERDLVDTARMIFDGADSRGCTIVLPGDAVVATEFAANAPHRIVPVADVGKDEMILDAGPQSVEAVTAVFDASRTLVWNGPFGAFELPPFDAATVAAARHAADRTRQGHLVSVAGGGDTVAALNHAGVAETFSYVSTAGGAFLEWLEGKALPGVEALRQG